MEISEYTEYPEKEWMALLDLSDDVWLYHSLSWMNMTANVYSLKNHYFIASENGSVIGALPVQVFRNGIWPIRINAAHSTYMGSSGPFCLRDLPRGKKELIYLELTRSLIKWAKENSIDNIYCSLSPLSYSNTNNNSGINPLVLSGWRDTSTHTRIIDLNKSEEDLLKGITKDARQQIKKTSSKGYYVKRVNWTTILNTYYDVHKETYNRTGVKPHPFEYFKTIAALGENNNAVLWAGFDRSGKPVAFHNDGRYREGSHYWTGCCETEHLGSGINYLLFWESIKGAKRDGCRYYNIGEVFPNVNKGKLNGLTIFKSKFGGELYRFYKGEIDLTSPSITQKFIRAYRCFRGRG